MKFHGTFTLIALMALMAFSARPGEGGRAKLQARLTALKQIVKEL